MAQNKYALARYCLIDNLLRKFKFVKTIYIVEICKKKLRCNITQRTIQMDIDAMKNDTFLGFYAPIEYCNKRKAYYYQDSEYQFSPLQFSNDEILLMQRLLVLLRDLIIRDEYDLLRDIVGKIRIYSH